MFNPQTSHCDEVSLVAASRHSHPHLGDTCLVRTAGVWTLGHWLIHWHQPDYERLVADHADVRITTTDLRSSLKLLESIRDLWQNPKDLEGSHNLILMESDFSFFSFARRLACSSSKCKGEGTTSRRRADYRLPLLHFTSFRSKDCRSVSAQSDASSANREE